MMNVLMWNNIPHHAPRHEQKEEHKRCLRRELTLVPPPQCRGWDGNEEERIEEESLNDVAMQKCQHHALPAAGWAVETGDVVERTRQHVNLRFDDLQFTIYFRLTILLFFDLLFILQ